MYKNFSQELHNDVIALSSGTIASLSGCQRYEDIDIIQQDLAHLVRAFPNRFHTWVDVWNFYKNSCPSLKKIA